MLSGHDCAENMLCVHAKRQNETNKFQVWKHPRHPQPLHDLLLGDQQYAGIKHKFGGWAWPPAASHTYREQSKCHWQRSELRISTRQAKWENCHGGSAQSFQPRPLPPRPLGGPPPRMPPRPIVVHVSHYSSTKMARLPLVGIIRPRESANCSMTITSIREFDAHLVDHHDPPALIPSLLTAPL